MRKAKHLIVALLMAALLLSGFAPITARAEAPKAAGPHLSAVTKSASPLFRAQFEGDTVEGTGSIVDGVYRIAATKTDGEAWHIKLESNYPTTPGNEYHVTYRFHSDVAGHVKFGDFQEYDIVAGDNELTGLVIAKDGTSYLDLQLGLLKPFTIDFSEIEVVEIQDDVEYVDAMPGPVLFDGDDAIYERHDEGYSPNFERAEDHITVSYDVMNRDPGVWKARLYVRTGMVPEAGNRYRVSVDVLGEEDMDFEVLLNREDQEKGYGALYGRHLTGGELQTVQTVLNFPPSGYYDGELVMQFSLGNAPDGVPVTISNLHIDKIVDGYSSRLPAGFALDKIVSTGKNITSMNPTGYKALSLKDFSYTGSDNVFERHDDDYKVSLQESASSATLKITKAPENDRGVWKAKLYAATGTVLEGGKSYVIKFDVKGSRDQAEYEACFDGDYENAYGALYGRSLKAGTADHIEYFLTPDVAHGPLTLRLQLGKTDSTKGNNITLSGFSIEEVKTTAQDIGSQSYDTGSSETITDVPMPGFAYPVTTEAETIHVDDAYVPQTVSLSAAAIAWDDSEASASVEGGGAKLVIAKARDPERGGVWSQRLQVGTGVVLEPGVTYQVSASLAAEQATGDWELLLSNGQDETDFNPGGNGYGFGPGGNGNGNVSFTFTAPSGLSEYKELVLRFQLGNSAENTITVSGISVSKLVPAHDETKGGSTENNSFFIETNNGTEAGLTGNGSSATAHVITPGDDWHIKLYALTGVTLESGKTYKISMKVSGAGNWNVAYKRSGGEETDFNGAMTFGDTVTNTVTVPADMSGTLEILLKLGSVAADGKVTVSDIKIQEISGSSGGYAPINFWAHEDYSASASNTDSSATLKIASAPDGGREVWKVKLFAETGVTLEPGKAYRVLADVAASNDLDYEICYNRNEVEKGFDAAYGLHAGSAAQTVSTDISPDSEGQLILQFSVGNAVSGTEVTISNIKVQELVLSGGTNLIEGYSYNSVGFISSAADGGYIVSLDQHSSSADFKIHQAPAERKPWNVKLNVRTGFTPESGKGYRVSFDIKAAKAQSLMEVFYDGSSEHAYGSLYNQSLAAGSKKTISYTIYPGQPKGELVLQIRLGQTNATSGNSYTISNLKLEEVSFTTTTTPETREVTELWTHNGYRAELKKTAKTAVVNFREVPAEGREPWKTKLFIDTGVTLQKGEKYRISFEAFSNMDTPLEVCYNRDGEEKAVGAIYGLTTTMEPQVVEYVTYAAEDAHLIIQLTLGNATAPTTFNVGHVKVEKAGTTSQVSDTIYTF